MHLLTKGNDMTDNEIHGIFSRFQNLNLLFLIEDLRRGKVARGEWLRQRTKNICPIGHGWCRKPAMLPESWILGVVMEDGYALAGINDEDGAGFVRWWD